MSTDIVKPEFSILLTCVERDKKFADIYVKNFAQLYPFLDAIMKFIPFDSLTFFDRRFPSKEDIALEESIKRKIFKYLLKNSRPLNLWTINEKSFIEEVILRLKNRKDNQGTYEISFFTRKDNFDYDYCYKAIDLMETFQKILIKFGLSVKHGVRETISFTRNKSSILNQIYTLLSTFHIDPSYTGDIQKTEKQMDLYFRLVELCKTNSLFWNYSTTY